MVARKLGREKKERPKIIGPKGLKVPRRLNVDALPDAIVDGKFTCTVGEVLVFRKDYLKDVTTSYCTVMAIDEKAGRADMWDETIQQWTAAEISDADRFTLKRKEVHPLDDR